MYAGTHGKSADPTGGVCGAAGGEIGLTPNACPYPVSILQKFLKEYDISPCTPRTGPRAGNEVQEKVFTLGVHTCGSLKKINPPTG